MADELVGRRRRNGSVSAGMLANVLEMALFRVTSCTGK